MDNPLEIQTKLIELYIKYCWLWFYFDTFSVVIFLVSPWLPIATYLSSLHVNEPWLQLVSRSIYSMYL